MSDFAEFEKQGVMINAHYVGPERKRIEVEWFMVPKELRGKGVGRQAFEAWERSLDPQVELVTLFAADSDGRGNSDDFWDKLGFSWVFTSDGASDIPYESAHRMHKGVNGHATPKPVWWADEDDLDDGLEDGQAPPRQGMAGPR